MQLKLLVTLCSECRGFLAEKPDRVGVARPEVRGQAARVDDIPTLGTDEHLEISEDHETVHEATVEAGATRGSMVVRSAATRSATVGPAGEDRDGRAPGPRLLGGQGGAPPVEG